METRKQLGENQRGHRVSLTVSMGSAIGATVTALAALLTGCHSQNQQNPWTSCQAATGDLSQVNTDLQSLLPGNSNAKYAAETIQTVQSAIIDVEKKDCSAAYGVTAIAVDQLKSAGKSWLYES